MGIPPMEYCQSFRDYEDGAAGMKERFSEGKSGSFMYFTFDRRYIVKTIPMEEVDCMMEILPEYTAHVAASNGGTLLHYYGCHSIRLPNRRARVYCVVMKNFLQDPHVPRVRSLMRSTFDLKGCRFLRTAEEGSGTLLDNDWLDVLDDFTVRNMCEEDARRGVQKWIARDAAFLSQMGVMDYSLLVGIADVTTVRDSQLSTSYGSQGGSGYSTPGQRNSMEAMQAVPWSPGQQGSRSHVVYGEGHVLYFGIIDILQKYDCRWTIQRIVLTAYLWLVCGDSESITAVPPAMYAQRFAKFTESDVLQVDPEHQNNQSPALWSPLGRLDGTPFFTPAALPPAAGGSAGGGDAAEPLLPTPVGPVSAPV